MEYRDRRGSFESWDDVEQVPSYEDGMVERLQSAGFSIGHGAELRRESSRQDAANRTGSGSRSLNRASAAELEDTHMIDGERARRLVRDRRRDRESAAR